MIARLLSDHAEFRALGQEIEAIFRAPPPTHDRARLVDLVTTFQRKLAEHSAREDDVFYPALRAVLHRSVLIDEKYMNHLDNEHRSIDGHLTRLLEEVSAARLMVGWGQTFAVFSVGLRSHMRREEEELFPEARRLLGDAA